MSTKSKNNAVKTWRTIHRRSDGSVVLLSPDGREYRGTPAEIRAAALAPERRRMLASGLKVAWLVYEPRTPERAWVAAERRRAAIEGAALDAWHGRVPAQIPLDLAILAEAAARFMGRPFDVFVEEAVAAMVDAARDEADGGVIPLTRHERAALARLEGEGARDE